VVAPWYWHDARPTRLETRLSPGERHNRGASAIRRSTRHLFQNHRCAKRRAGSLAALQGWRHSPANECAAGPEAWVPLHDHGWSSTTTPRRSQKRGDRKSKSVLPLSALAFSAFLRGGGAIRQRRQNLGYNGQLFLRCSNLIGDLQIQLNSQARSHDDLAITCLKPSSILGD
jgi:hypothetical protein